jgi:hypothetical protein
MAGIAVAAAAVTVVPTTGASAAASIVCVVTTTGVPVYSNPPDSGLPYSIVAWVNTGQKITVTTEWNYWRGGTTSATSMRTTWSKRAAVAAPSVLRRKFAS